MHQILPPQDVCKEKKKVCLLKRQDGTLTWDHQEKEQIIHEYFSNIIGTKEQCSRTLDWDKLGLSRLQEVPGLELDQPFIEAEIKSAVKSLPNGKAPSPDGFTNDFFEACWDIIKFNILSAFHSIHIHHCDHLGKINGAQVVLIPKVEVATEPKDFRPISLIHSFAKLFMKVLALRLASYIDNLISDTQSAFMKGRCIQKNFIYVRGVS